MKNQLKFLFIFLFFLTVSLIYSNETNNKNITINFRYAENIKFKFNNDINKFQITNYQDNEEQNKELPKKNKKKIEDDEEKSKIFDKPDFSWLKEKNRLEKIFIAVGIVTSSVGAGILLAGLINLLVTFDAVSIDNEPIMNSYYVYYSLIGTGAGLIGVGAAFIIVGGVRLGIKNKKAKAELSFLFIPYNH